MEETSIKQLVMQMFDDYKKETDKRFDKHELRMDKQDIRADKQDERIDGIDRVQTIQGEQIKGIEKSLDAIHDDTRWLRRTFTGGAITALIGGLASLVFFAIKLGGG